SPRPRTRLRARPTRRGQAAGAARPAAGISPVSRAATISLRRPRTPGSRRPGRSPGRSSGFDPARGLAARGLSRPPDGGTTRSKVPPSPGMRVIHAADLHIDSPLRGLGRIEGAPVDDIRLATRRAFSRLVDTCLEDQASLLILAGDVF